jgi:DNA-binding response OmpR family regulator
LSAILLFQIPNSELPDLRRALDKKGFEITHFNGPEVLLSLANGSIFEQVDPSAIDLAILDLSAGHGAEVVEQAFQPHCEYLPIILLISEDMDPDPAFERLTCGNVLRMPFTARKVTNRVRKLLDSRHGDMLQRGDLSLNLGTRCVYKGRIFHRLTPRQSKLLEVFMRHPNQTLTRRFLMENVWDTDYMGDTRTLDVHVRWIRERIEDDPSEPKYLRTVRGIGYRFGIPDSDE